MRKLGFFLVASLFSVAASAQSIRFEHNTLFVKLKHGEALPQHELIEAQKHLFGDLWEVTTSDAVLLENDLRIDPVVKWTEKSFYAGARDLALPSSNKNLPEEMLDISFNDPMAGRVWAFNDASRNGVSVNRAYSELPSRAAKTVVVAVVDTGVDYNHEDLKDVMWVNEGEIAGNGQDDDNNGYVDDIYGINTIDRTTNPIDTHSHGTHVSGTIGAKQNNGKGIAGIASDVKIMAIRTVPNDGDETDKNVVESFLYAAKNGAKLINCSFGKKVNEGGMVVSETIKFVGETYGTLVVAAAGNDSFGPFRWHNIDTDRRFPASFGNAHLLVIAATNSNGGLASFSNVGKVGVDVAAPGQDVLSTTPGNQYQSFSGTSMATPTTVGVAAQILSYFPGLTALQLKDVLMSSVTAVPAFADKMVTGGRIDLSAALKFAATKYPQAAQE